MTSWPKLRTPPPYSCLDEVYAVFACRGEFPTDPRLLLGAARIHDQLGDHEKAIAFYKSVLLLDATNVESIACLGAHFFYSDQVT